MAHDAPSALVHAIEGALADYDVRDLRRTVEVLSERYRSGTKAHSTVQTDLEAAAYAAYRMSATYAAIRSAMHQVSLRLQGWQPQSLLDIGAGTGAGIWAAIDQWPSLTDCLLMDQSPAMINFGKRLSAYLSSRDQFSVEWILGRIAPDEQHHDANLVLVSYVLNEVRSDDVLRYVEWLWGQTDGLLLIVEPGTPEGFRTVRLARARLIELGGTVVAPCPHDLACPMQPGDWCHFSVRLARSRFHREVKPGTLAYEDEKFAYVAVSRTPAAPASARVLRHPTYRRGLVNLELCTTHGLESRVISKRRDRQHYRQARSVSWGDGFPPNTPDGDAIKGC